MDWIVLEARKQFHGSVQCAVMHLEVLLLADYLVMQAETE